MTTAGRRVLVVGDVMTDIICRPEGPLVPGSDRRAAIALKPGGSGANQAVWLAAAGVDVRFAARVGDADVARFSDHFRRAGIEPVLAGDARRGSGVIVTIVDPDGERSFLTDRGANMALGKADLPAGLLEDCAILVVSGYALFEPGPRQAVLALIAAGRARGVEIAVDPASTGFLAEVGANNFIGWTRGADTLFANAAEALDLSGTGSVEAAVRELGTAYRRVVVKCGADGAVLGGVAGISARQAAPKVAAIDTTGAGDAFAAAFIAAELLDCGEAEALARAVAAGSAAVTQIGGQPPQRS